MWLPLAMASRWGANGAGGILSAWESSGTKREARNDG